VSIVTPGELSQKRPVFTYGVRPLDLETLVTVGMVLLAIATAAASLPALRAAQVDPMEALRTE
jgi:ABC-type antimicrobial peptide transport system permease subunit